MNLSPMRFKNFVWPHNPVVYSITYERKMAVHKIPFGRHHLQSLGQTRRVMRGEGEFVGEGAYERFSALATVFYEETPGTLIHPVWVTTTAWFVGLELKQEPRADYVRYSFEFWEVIGEQNTTLSAAEGGQPDSSYGPLWHTVVRGDTLWGLSKTYGTALETLVELNPQIRNPNLIRVGEKVCVR